MIALIITLVLVGLILLAAEILIIPGFGIAGIAGLCSLGASCYAAFSAFGQTAGLLVTAGNIILVVGSTVLMLRSRTWKKIGLKTNIDARVDGRPEEKGIRPGQKGTTLTRLAPGGQARIGEHTVEVFTRDSLVEPGQEIEVLETEGNRIIVSGIHPGTPASESGKQTE